MSVDKPAPGADFPSRRLVIDRCQDCGAVRLHGDDWIVPLGAANLASALGVLDPTSPVLAALADHWELTWAAGGSAFATDWTGARDLGAPDLVEAADDIPLVDLYAYDCAAAGCAPPQIGVPVHAPHLRALLSAFMAAQIAMVVTMQAEIGPAAVSERSGPTSAVRSLLCGRSRRANGTH